jgi:hypothetical protein
MIVPDLKSKDKQKVPEHTQSEDVRKVRQIDPRDYLEKELYGVEREKILTPISEQ